MSRWLTRTLVVTALAALVGSCGDERPAPADVEQMYVDHGEQSLQLTQRFDDQGELVETVVMHRADGGERVTRALGPLMTAEGATDGGQRLRRFFTTLDPSLLARLHEAGLRYDLAVLAADALLALDEAGQRQAARELTGDGVGGGADEPAELCVLLGACGASGIAPQT